MRNVENRVQMEYPHNLLFAIRGLVFILRFLLQFFQGKNCATRKVLVAIFPKEKLRDPEGPRYQFADANWAPPNGLVTNFLSENCKERMPSSRHPAAVRRTAAFNCSSPFRVHKNNTIPMGWCYFYGDPERTRTVDLQRDRLAC